MKTSSACATALFGIALLLAGCSDKPSRDSPDTAAQAPAQIAFQLNDVNADSLTALRLDASDRGKVLVIDCWATWCSSCVAMFPQLHDAIKKRGQDVVMVSLTFDEGQANIDNAKQFLMQQQATDNAYRAADGSDAKDAIAKALSSTWDGGVLPAVFVYRTDGSIALEFTETRGDVSDWVNEIALAVDTALQDANDSPRQ